MGRRALPKVPPCDLTGHLYELEQMTPPLRLDELFPDSTAIEIEVGSGKGLFLTSAAEAAPDRSFLGIEIARKYARFVAYRLASNQLRNAKVIHGDAEVLFRDYLPDQHVSAVHIYFPDPWWKKRHHKRRIMNHGFLEQVDRVLRPGGRLHFWTDVEDYFSSSLGTVASATALRGPLQVLESEPRHDLDYRTHFERKKRQGGNTIYRAEFEKS